MRNWIVQVGLVAVFLSTLPLTGKAQDSAAMTGVVTDATGAVVPGTRITLINPLTGVAYTQTTDQLGSYRFASVPPGNGYDANFTHDGFASVSMQHLALGVGITRTQDAKLLAGASQQVEVSAANSVETLNTTDASIGNNLDVNVLNELPVQDRTAGITSLFYLQPGVDAATGAVTGAREDQSETTVDGMDVNDLSAGQNANGFVIVGNAPVDSVEEFRGVVAGLVTSVGTGSGGQFQLVTRSGTNQFHGNINEYNRNTDTEANNYFNNLVGVPRTPLVRNQFGGSIGGPIKRDKLFFFFDVADSRIATSTPEERIVPLAAFRAGTLNYITDAPGCLDSSRLNTTPQCIATLTAAQVAALDPTTTMPKGFDAALLSTLNARYPMANDVTQGDGVNTGGFRFNAPNPDNENTYVSRIDYNLTSKQTIFGRFTINREDEPGYRSSEFPGDPATQPFIDRSYSYVVSHIWTIGSNKVNQFYYGDVISKYDFPFEYNPTGANQISLTPPGVNGLTGPYYSNVSGQDRRVPVPEVRDDFNWQVGHHTLTFGGTFKFIKTNSELLYNFNFVDAGLQGNALQGGLDASVRPPNIGTGQNATNDYDDLFADALGVIGEVSSNYDYNTEGTALPQGSGSTRAYRFFETELYAGDTWKVNPQLTFSYGLRYQLYTVPYEAHGEESVPFFTTGSGPVSPQKSTFDSYIAARVAQSAAGATGNSAVPIISYELGGKANNGPNLYAPSYKDFAPRFAVAYNPSWLPKTVFNAGAGIVYDRTVINAINFNQDQSSYLFQASNTNQFGSTGAAASLEADPRLGSNLSYPTSDVPAAPVVTRPYTPYVDGTGTPYGLAASEYNTAIDPTLMDPYAITLNAGVQQELPGHIILKINYAGRLGRRLIAQADGSQLIDFPDKVSGQELSAAFASLVTQTRAGVPYTKVTKQPWFEDVIPAGTGASLAPLFGIRGVSTNTQFVDALFGQLAQRGDFADSVEELAAYSYDYGFPLLPTNAGMASQFGGNTYITNKGSSAYNGLLVTVDKNLSQGLQFDFNYTWSHSIDNTSQVANSIASSTGYGFICDVLRPRECRANSDFDVTQEINTNFTYQLPVGRGRQFLGNAPRWVDEAIGGWSLSGTPFYRTGQAVNVYSDAFVAGYANDAPAIFTGNRRDVKAMINQSNGTVYEFGGGQNGANKALSDFTGPVGFQIGQRNYLRGPGAFTMDAGLAKSFPIIENKLTLNFRADAFNVFNHTVFDAPSLVNTPQYPLNIVTNASPFGQVTATPSGTSRGAPRVAQFSARLEF